MSSGFYETDQAVSEYLLFHYGSPEEILPYPFGPSDALDFPVRCVRDCLDLKRIPPQARALDLGCAVGRASFELARFCTEVIGIDCSHRFIEAAKVLQRHGSLAFQYVDEGSLMKSAAALVPLEIERDRVSFEQGDAQNLRPDIGRFDVLLAANLIDRLGDPRQCLIRFSGLVRAGGQLILTSPYTWLKEFTPADNWLGGFDRDGQSVRTFDMLKQSLEPAFQFVSRNDLPFLIREHARKYQWGVGEASVWIRSNDL
ncbi:MAG: putative 4-mercaptohistidine N1-methyltransferase [Verrucomicrobia bacterium]|nr:putative 4-mercaptohistidine N1-methyltransferase [Verrucomicrobiota bacterium]